LGGKGVINDPKELRVGGLDFLFTIWFFTHRIAFCYSIE